MSDKEVSQPRRRRQRNDAQRNSAVVLDAAITLLGGHPSASMEEIAIAAGVSRQTVYAHYPTREILLQAILARLTSELTATLGSTDFVTGPALAALKRWLKISWGLIDRYPVLLNAGLDSGSAPDEPDRHAPVAEDLLQLTLRGQQTGEFDPRLAASWLVAATIGLGHAAGQQVSAGLMSSQEAGTAFHDSVLRLYTAHGA